VSVTADPGGENLGRARSVLRRGISMLGSTNVDQMSGTLAPSSTTELELL
jgi:hypothetical protein